MEKYALLATATALTFVGVAGAAVVGTDNATSPEYSDGWQSGDNGAGLGAWNLYTSATDVNNPTGFAGFFIGDSTSLGGSGINTGGSAFGMYGNQGNTYANAERFLTSALDANQKFSFDLAANYRNGAKGVNLVDGSGNSIFNFNVGGDDYTVNGTSIGNAYSADSKFNLAFNQTSLSGGTWTITRSGGVSDLDTGTYSGDAAGFRLYIGQTDNGDQNNLFTNNFTVTTVPEPASLAVLGLGAIGLLRRRK